MFNHEAATGTASAPVGRIASFGKYLLLQRVSVGGMAEVFKAIPEGATGIDQIVAIKRILPNIAEDREFIGMFIDEARIAGQLTHPNICRIYELGRVGADHYIAMQFLWGRDLLKVMNRFKRAGLLIPPPMTVFIAAHACGALHYAHFKSDAAGQPLHIIHRDVSPQNIIVGYSGQAKLIDFGVARAASQSQKTQAGILKGKFGYMSPEMIRGLPVDHRSDVFAMGICLHEALTGSRLFYGETDFATLELVRDAKILPPSAKVPSIPAELDAIVLKALSRDADQRYQSANALAEALDLYLEKNHPGYGEAEVGAIMSEAFAHELAREKQRLDAFARMLERAELVRGAALPALPSDPPPSGERSAVSGDVAVPNHAPAKPASAPAETVRSEHADAPDMSDEQTQIFFSAAELNEIRQLGTQPQGQTQRPAGVSEVIMRSSTGISTPPPKLLAPNFNGPTPSGTYARRPDEGQAPPLVTSGSNRRLNDPNLRTQTITAHGAARAHRTGTGASTLRSSLLALAALLLAALAYTVVSLGTRRTATLEIGAVGARGALVRVDGILRGNPPLTVSGLAPGVHAVDLEAPGFEVVHMDVSMEAGDRRALKLVLSQQAKPSVNALAADESSPADPAPPVKAAPGPAGGVPGRPPLRPLPRPRTDLVPPLAGARPAQPSIAPAADAEAQVSKPAAAATAGSETQVGEAVNHEAAAAGEGELLISTVPWSRVIIDGSDTGRDTPVRALRVAAGDHLIVLRTPEGEEHSVNVAVEPGKTVRIIRRF